MRPHFDIRGATGGDKQIGYVGCCVCANARTWSTRFQGKGWSGLIACARKSPPGDDKAIIGINVTFSACQSITNQWKQSDYKNLTELCPPRGNPSPFHKSDNGGYHVNGKNLSFGRGGRNTRTLASMGCPHGELIRSVAFYVNSN